MSKPGAKKTAAVKKPGFKAELVKFLTLPGTIAKDTCVRAEGKNPSSSDPDENPAYPFKSEDELEVPADKLRKYTFNGTIAAGDDAEMKKYRIPNSVPKAVATYINTNASGYAALEILVTELKDEYAAMEDSIRNAKDSEAAIAKLIEENRARPTGSGSLLALLLTAQKEGKITIKHANPLASAISTELSCKEKTIDADMINAFCVFVKTVMLFCVASSYPSKAAISKDTVIATLNFISLTYGAPYGAIMMNEIALLTETQSKEKKGSKPAAAATATKPASMDTDEDYIG